MNPQLTAIILAVLGALAPFVRAWVLTKLTPERLAHVNDIARIAVRAAEKLGDDTSASGQQKLNYASEVLVTGAKRLGIRLSQDEVLAFIHAALREMQQVEGAHLV